MTERSRVQVLETTSCVKNRVRLRTIHQMVGPLPGPCVCGSFSAPGCPFYIFYMNNASFIGVKLFIYKKYLNDTIIASLCFFSVLNLPTGQNRPLPYILTLVPPLILSLLDPEIFFKALDFAGTYGGIAKCSFLFHFHVDFNCNFFS